MLILAHRGFHAGQPENTMGAFEAARKLGVDGIETDVRLSADGAGEISIFAPDHGQFVSP